MPTTMAATQQIPTMLPEHVQLYRGHATRLTLRGALNALQTIVKDRAMLHELGDKEAVAGATILLREALIDVIAVPATSAAEHAAKNQAINETVEMVTLEAPWLVELMIITTMKTEQEQLEGDVD